MLEIEREEKYRAAAKGAKPRAAGSLRPKAAPAYKPPTIDDDDEITRLAILEIQEEQRDIERMISKSHVVEETPKNPPWARQMKKPNPPIRSGEPTTDDKPNPFSGVLKKGNAPLRDNIKKEDDKPSGIVSIKKVAVEPPKNEGSNVSPYGGLRKIAGPARDPPPKEENQKIIAEYQQQIANLEKKNQELMKEKDRLNAVVTGENLSSLSDEDFTNLFQKVLEEKNNRSCCVVCLERPRSIVCTPCGHFCLCQKCSQCIKNTCPVCRSNVISFTKIFT